MKRIWTLILVGVLAALPLAAQAQEFPDGCGREVTVSDSIERIAVTGPLAQGMLYALAPDMLVGLAEGWDDGDAQYIPEKYVALPVLGQLYGGKGEINLEALLLEDPQVLIDVGEGKQSIVQDMEDLQKQTGIPCVHVEAAMDTYPEALRQLGGLLGCEDRAEELALLCEKIADRTAGIMDQVGEENRVKAVYCLGEDGLNVIAKTAYHAEVFDMLVDNQAVLEEVSSRGTGNAVDMEQLLTWDPDLIVFAPGDLYETVGTDDAWASLKAISTGNYIETPDGPMNWMGFPPAVQRYLAMIWLPAVLYPQYVDYDVYEEVSTFYQLFFHCSLTREQFEELTKNSWIQGAVE